MRTAYYLFLLFILPCGLHAQYAGFMGKKVVFQVGGSPWIPVVQNAESNNYVNENGRLVESRLVVGLEARVGISVYPKRNVGFGIDVAQSWFSFDVPQYGNYNEFTGYSFSGEAEMMDVRALQIAPHLEFSNKQGLLPVGIAHNIGVGFNTYTLVKKDYLYEDGTVDPETLRDNFYNWRYDTFKGFSIIYGLNMRLPLSERLLLTYNLNYSINIVTDQGSPASSGDYYISPEEMRQELRQTALYNILRMGIGLAVTL